VSVRVLFECGGCGLKVDGKAPLRKRFESFSGRDHGFGRAVWDVRVEDIVPEGWIAFDPYTYACYCPACWSEIENTATDNPR